MEAPIIGSNRLVAAFLLFGMLGTTGRGDEPNKPADPAEAKLGFLKELRSRNLSELSRAYSRRLLADRTLPPKLRSETVLELSGHLSGQANRTVDATQRRQLWSRADEMIDVFFRDEADYPSLPLVRYRWTGQLLDRSRMAYELGKVLSDDPSLAEDAAKWAERARDELTLVRNAAEEALKGEDRLILNQRDGLTLDEWGSLSMAAAFRSGVAWVAAARTAEGADLKNAVSNAEEYLDSFTANFAPNDITMESHLALAEAYELASRDADALRLLERFDADDVPDAFRKRAHLIRSGILLGAGEVETALGLLNVSTANRLPGAEWELRLFEALLRRGSQIREKNAELADRLQEEALEILDRLEDSYGRYWGKRGEKSLAEHGNLASDNVRALRRLANVLRDQGQATKAIEKYRLATKLARDRGANEQAFETGFAAGSLLLELKRNEEAAQAIADAISLDPENALAARAKLTQAYALGRIWAKSGESADELTYRAALNAALESENDLVAAEARWMLAEAEEHAGNLPGALEQYQAVPTTHGRFGDALSAVAAIYHDAFLTDGADAGIGKTLEQAAANLEAMLDRSPAAGEPASPSASKDVAMGRYVLASLLAERPGMQLDRAVELLTGLLLDETALNDGLKGRAWSTLLRIHFSQGDVEQCRQMIAEAPPTRDEDLLRFLGGLPAVDAMPEASSELEYKRELVLAACDRLLAKEDLSARNRVNLRLLLAEARIADGEHDAARALLDRLRVEAPRDPRIVKFSAINEFRAGRFKESEKHWSLLQRGFSRGSDEWLDAVYHLIACAYEQGDEAKAKRLLTVTEQFYPELGGGRIRANYLDLKSRINGP